MEWLTAMLTISLYDGVFVKTAQLWRDWLLKTILLQENKNLLQTSYLANDDMTKGGVPGSRENNNEGLEVTIIFILA